MGELTLMLISMSTYEYACLQSHFRLGTVYSIGDTTHADEKQYSGGKPGWLPSPCD